jgi:SAM-dependent methyltransferase
VASLVADAYNRDPEREWARLERNPYYRLEFEVTWAALTRWIPQGAKMLDAGGGPGRYSLALCRAGYRVTLFDLSEGLLEKARAEFAGCPSEVAARLEGIDRGDLCDLSRYPNETFDAVVCLGGPLSHMPDEGDRRKAVDEMARVVRPGGLVFLSGVGFLAVQRWMLNNLSDDLISGEFISFLETGNISGATRTTWHFFRAAELRALGESCGLQTLEMRGCQGLSASLETATNRLAAERPDLWQVWHQRILDSSADPALVDTSEHILWIGRK